MASVAAMEGQLRELREKNAASAAALRAMVAQGQEIEASVQNKRGLRPLVIDLRAEAEALTGKLLDSSNVVQQVVESVRVLDTAQGNTKKALERAVDIVGLKTCVHEVGGAMQSENWEQAADSIQRYIHVAPEDSHAEEAALQSLRKSLAELRKIISDKCNQAAAARDQKEVVRFSKILTQIGLEDEGVERYTEYLGDRVSKAAEAEVAQLKNLLAMGATGGNVALYAKSLTKVLELVAQAITEGEELVRESFGETSIVHLMEVVYAKAASSIAQVLEQMYTRKSVAALSRKYRDNQQLEQKAALELDVLLEEISLCLQRLEQFKWYLSSKSAEAAAKTEGQENKAQELQRVVIVDVKKAELISGYIPLEEAFLRHSVEKAIRNKDKDEETMVSAFVDEVFFVLKKCIRRALATSNINAMADVIMYVHSILVTTYKEALETMLAAQDRSGELAVSAGISQLFAGTTVGGQVADLSRRQVAEAFDATCYNNLEVSASNVGKLHASLESELKRIFRGSAPSEEGKARECMSELANASQVLTKALQDAISRLATVLERFLKPALDLFKDNDYETNQAPYVESGAVVELISSVETTLEPFREGLNTNCFDTLVTTIISEHVLPTLERLAIGKKAAHFTALGAMQFDKDLRAITVFFSEMTQRTVRDQFTRLSQISLVLNLGDPSEIMEYNWRDQGSGAVVWRLNGDEVRKVHCLWFGARCLCPKPKGFRHLRSKPRCQGSGMNSWD